MSKKLGLALGSGGSRGVSHIGFLKALEENGIKPDYISGCSMGSVVGGCYALGMSAEKMHKIVMKLKFSDIFDLSINPYHNGALLATKKMRKQLEKYLKDYKFNQTAIPFTCVATDLIKGQTYLFKDEENMLDGIMASSTIPGVFKPLEYNGMTLVDGGVKCRVPIDQVREMGADVVVAVDALGSLRESKKKYNVLAVLLRTFDICDYEITSARLEKQKPDLFLEPDLGEMVMYKFKDLEMAYQKGYETGVQNINKIRELLK